MKKGCGMPVILSYFFLSSFIMFGLMTVSGITGCGGGGDGGGGPASYELEKHLIEPSYPRAANVVFQVSDMAGNGVSALRTSDFVVYEDSQEMSYLDSEMNVRKRSSLPSDISYTIKTVLLLDNSPSVAGPSNDDNLQRIKDAARAMVKEIDEQQQFAVYAFSDKMTQLVEGDEIFISEAPKLEQAIYGMVQAYGTTDLFGSVLNGLSLWEDDYSANVDTNSSADQSGSGSSDGQPTSMSQAIFSAVSKKPSAAEAPTNEFVQGFLVLVTDGYHTVGAYDFENILNERDGKRIFTVALGPEIAADGLALEQLEKLGNAGFYLIPDASYLEGTLRDIQRRIVEYANSFYWLQYKSPRTSSDEEKNFEITVEIKNNGNTEENYSITEEDVTTSVFFSEQPGVYVNAIPSSDPNGITLDEYGAQIVEPVVYLEMYDKDTFDLNATTYKPTQYPSHYVWQPDDPTVAEVEIPDENDTAKATVVTAKNPGRITITVTDTDNYLSAKIPVRVVLLDPPPILHYPFTGNADDDSGSGYDGEVFGAELSFDRTGEPGTAYSFDGSSNYIAIDKLVADEEAGIAGITVCAWIKTASDKEQSIISFDRAENWALSMVDGKISWDTKDFDLTPTHSLVTDDRYNDDKWHLICAVFQATSIQDKKIYVDGLLVKEATKAHDKRNLGTGRARSGIIGADCKPEECAESNFFEGKIDEVYIYGGALPEDEIKFMYKTTVWDEVPEAELSIDDVEVSEDAGEAVFTLSVTSPIGRYITVNYQTGGGTATAGSDYVATAGTAIIPPGDTETQIIVPIIDDTRYEKAETFLVTLSDPLNACFTKDTGIGTIIDNDIWYEDGENGDTLGWSVYSGPTGASISLVEDLEPGHSASHAIQLSGSGTDSVFVFRNPDGSLWHNSTDFLFQWNMRCSEEVQLFVDVETSAGQRYLVYKTVDGDDPAYGHYIYHGLGSGVVDGKWHTFLRDLQHDLNDAQPDVKLLEVNRLFIRGNVRVDDIAFRESVMFLSVSSDVSVNEDAGEAVFRIRLSETTDKEVTVNYTTVDYTAKEGEDYTKTEGTATFSAFSTPDNEYPVSVPILDDSLYEPNNEVFFLILSDAHNAWLPVGTETGKATIIDNDPQPPTVYEDAENQEPEEIACIDGCGTDQVCINDCYALGWTVTDNNPAGAQIDNIYDDDRASQVIEFTGASFNPPQQDGNAYLLRNEDGSPWHNKTQFVLEWSMKCTENVGIYAEVLTTSYRQKYLYYSLVDEDALGGGDYVHHGLGLDARDGQWHTFKRDLGYDLNDAQWGERIAEVNGLFIRGNARVDDIILSNSQSFLSVNDVQVNENDGSAVFTITADGTWDGDIVVDYVTSDDTAEAGSDYVLTSGTAVISPGESSVEVSVPIIDDVVYEGEESFFIHLRSPVNAQIADPLGVCIIRDNDNPPTYTVYENAEDGLTNGWNVSDNDPSGAQIDNVEDTDSGHGGYRVIELSGDGTLNSYQLRKEDGSAWLNTTEFLFEWSMKCSELVGVYVDVQTSKGHRFLWYETIDDSYLGTKEYVHFGLGSGAMDGQWHTYVRNLKADLRSAQWDAEILSVNSVYFRGNARVDDIRLSPLTGISISNVTVPEEGGPAVLTITSSIAPDTAIVVSYITTDGTALAGSDYEAITPANPGEVTIEAGTTTANAEVNVGIIDDGDYEGNESFQVVLSISPDYPVNIWLEKPEGVVTIDDND
jgi:hypothetical protein